MVLVAAGALACVTGTISGVSRTSDEDVARYARLLAMADARRQDRAVIDRALRARSALVRASAALAIGQVQATDLAPRLRALVFDPDTGVSANAGFALGLLRDSAAVAVLDTALSLPGPVAAEAAWALGEIGEPARTAITSALMWASPPRPVHEELLLAAAKLRPVPVPEIVRWLGDPDPDVAWRAAYAIARPRTAAGVRALLGFALHADHRVRAQVARGLTKDAAGDSLAQVSMTRLSVLASDRHPHVRINAIRSFATYGDSARLALIATAKDSDANVRIAAAQSLGLVMDRDLVRWAWLWDADTTLAYRQAILASAAAAGVWLPAVRDWIGADDWRLRAAVAEAAAASRDPERVRAFESRFGSDPDPRVRAAMTQAIAAFADSARVPWARASLFRALRDHDASVRATALVGLRARASAAEVPELVESYRASLVDSVPDALLAAVRALSSAWRNDSVAFDRNVEAMISSLPAPDDPIVRAAASGLRLFATWPPPRWEARPLSWYEDVARSLALRSDTAPPILGTIITDRGPVAIELLGVEAPLTVRNFVTLARAGFYHGVRFHRVVPNFVAQDGDPRGDGTGGPGYAIRDELNRRRYQRGVVGMALAGPETGGSQYFITHSPQPHLDGHYTVFARVIDGWDVLDAIIQGDRVERIVIP